MQQGADDPEFLKTMFLANGYSKISGGKIQKDKYNILMSDIRYYMGGEADTWKRCRKVIQSGGSDNVMNRARVKLEASAR